jgi:hypothetical protein
MKDSISKLTEHWMSMNLQLAAGNSEERVREFETRHGVIFPTDFKEYLLCVNGMVQAGGQDCDPNGFAFWPLARVQSIVKECAEHSLSPPEVSDKDSYFVFADYLQWSWAYAIRLSSNPSDPNPVIHVGTIRTKIVAPSFSEFVDSYIQDAKSLYPDTDEKLSGIAERS